MNITDLGFRRRRGKTTGEGDGLVCCCFVQALVGCCFGSVFGYRPSLAAALLCSSLDDGLPTDQVDGRGYAHCSSSVKVFGWYAFVLICPACLLVCLCAILIKPWLVLHAFDQALVSTACFDQAFPFERV
ncbi:hypothetical protein U1Q18_044314 [Sarracenia purpurea var. burkii]